MSNRLNILGFFIGSLCLLQSLRADNIVLDLDEVLFRTNEISTAKYMKTSNLIQGMAIFDEGKKEFQEHLKRKLAEVLFKVSMMNPAACITKSCALDVDGNPYPPIMCAWLAGTMTNEQIRTLVLSSIQAFPDWFDHRVEQKIITNIVNMIFTPEDFVSTRKPYRNSFRMVKRLKRDGHNIYILSNWDPESMNILIREYPKLFNMVSGVMISGEEHELKPSPVIYQRMLEKYNLNPQETWFIDNQQDNVNVAKSQNMSGILCIHKGGVRNRPDTRLIRKTIKIGRIQGIPQQ